MKVRYGQAAPDGTIIQETEALPWFEQVAKHAFDLRNYVILAWSTHQELRKVVDQHVRARGLDLPLRVA